MATLDRSLPMLFLRMFHRLTLLAGHGDGSLERRRAKVATLLTGGGKGCWRQRFAKAEAFLMYILNSVIGYIQRRKTILLFKQGF